VCSWECESWSSMHLSCAPNTIQEVPLWSSSSSSLCKGWWWLPMIMP
jgi:hypothetical protein